MQTPASVDKKKKLHSFALEIEVNAMWSWRSPTAAFQQNILYFLFLHLWSKVKNKKKNTQSCPHRVPIFEGWRKNR